MTDSVPFYIFVFRQLSHYRCRRALHGANEAPYRVGYDNRTN